MPLPPWRCCPPPLRSCCRGRPRSCAWPTRASPQTGVWPGRWTAAAASAGRRAGAPGCWRRTAATAGAAPWGSLQTSGGRWALWPVRPPRAPSLRSQRPWAETSVPSPDWTHWDCFTLLLLSLCTLFLSWHASILTHASCFCLWFQHFKTINNKTTINKKSRQCWDHWPTYLHGVVFFENDSFNFLLACRKVDMNPVVKS